MGLTNFLSKEEQEKIKERESEALKQKHILANAKENELIVQNIPKELARATAEMMFYKPVKLPVINFKSENTDFGKKEKVSFFCNPQELEALKLKFNVILQMEELRISGKDTSKFIEKVLS
jgi:hypothetical protein